ncbi:MAG: type I 3-dehydroquinate dehydratase [Phycisphaerales bacterium]|nr:type I 3-dehydroquinate dehydratase [Phycisphaerales bacterium]
MSLIAVSIAVHGADEVDSAIERAAAAVRGGAKLVEWRIDGLAEEDDALAAASQLVRRSPAPCIVTCRPVWEGGEYTGDEQKRMSLLEGLCAGDDRPRYVDVELAAYQRSMNMRQKVQLAVKHPAQPRDLDTSLILSSHDFQGRPADLIRRVEAMTNEPACAVVKIAWTARSLRDNLEAFDLLAERRKPMIALCMGPFGLMSRVLAPKFGGLLTFATDHPTEVTAPGQPTIEDLRGLYRFDRISPSTRVYGVIGWPVEHSKSPAIHNAGFEAVGHDGAYLPMPVPGGPTEYEHFKATVGAMIDHPRLNLRGASVTIPHKENLLRFVRERGGRIDPLVERIGAANTLVVGSAGALECLNTDSAAAVASLLHGMSIDNKQLPGKRIAVIGAGGVARAVVAGLSDLGATVVVFNRTAERAERLAADFNQRWTSIGAPAKVVVGKSDSLACGCFDVFINCTSIGMAGGPAPDESPLPDDVPLDDRVTVFDTVYAPAGRVGGRSPLIQEAAARGAKVITGVDMFIRQAAMQFEKWTGKPAPMEILRQSLNVQ